MGLFWPSSRYNLGIFRGPPLDIGGGGGGLEFLPGHFYLFHKGDGKLYFVTFRIGCISSLVAIYLFHFSHSNIYFQKISRAPPPAIILLVAGLPLAYVICPVFQWGLLSTPTKSWGNLNFEYILPYRPRSKLYHDK